MNRSSSFFPEISEISRFLRSVAQSAASQAGPRCQDRLPLAFDPAIAPSARLPGTAAHGHAVAGAGRVGLGKLGGCDAREDLVNRRII